MGARVVKVEHTSLVDQCRLRVYFAPQHTGKQPGLRLVQTANADETPAEDIALRGLNQYLRAHAAERTIDSLLQLFGDVLRRQLEVFVCRCQEFDIVAPLLTCANSKMGHMVTTTRKLDVDKPSSGPFKAPWR